MLGTNLFKRLSLAAALLALAGCCHVGGASQAPYGGATKKIPPERTIVDAQNTLDVTEDATFAIEDSRRFKFDFSGSFSNASGDLDFTQTEDKVLITFVIDDSAPEGLTFKRNGRDAMWIEPKADLIKAYQAEYGEQIPDDISPRRPYPSRLDQFTNFKVSKDGKTLTVLNQNDDGVLYRYNLRFDYKGKTVQLDPDMGNGTGPHD